MTAPTSDAGAHKTKSSDPPASLTVPRRPSAQLAPNGVRSWSCHTRVNAQHGTALHPSGSPPAISANPRRRTHAPTAIFTSLQSPFPLLLVRTRERHPRNRSTHPDLAHARTRPDVFSCSPSISLSLLSTLLLLAPLRGKPHRPARVAPLLSAGPPKNNFTSPLVQNQLARNSFSDPAQSGRNLALGRWPPLSL